MTTPLYVPDLIEYIGYVEHLIKTAEKNKTYTKHENQYRYGVIHMAIRYNFLGILCLLVDMEIVDVNYRYPNKGETPLHIACINNKLEIIKFLLEKEADVNVVDENGFLPLHWAAQYGSVEIIKELLKNNIDDISPRNKFGNTPLHLAVIGGNIENVRCLIEHGADLNAQNQDQQVPLELAWIYNQHSIYILLKHTIENKKQITIK